MLRLDSMRQDHIWLSCTRCMRVSFDLYATEKLNAVTLPGFLNVSKEVDCNVKVREQSISRAEHKSCI